MKLGTTRWETAPPTRRATRRKPHTDDEIQQRILARTEAFHAARETLANTDTPTDAQIRRFLTARIQLLNAYAQLRRLTGEPLICARCDKPIDGHYQLASDATGIIHRRPCTLHPVQPLPKRRHA